MGDQSSKRVMEVWSELGYFARAKAATLRAVRRLFSMFPQGLPGLALFLLRISVAANFLMNATNRSGAYANLFLAGALLIFLPLTIGFLTPILSFLVCASAVADLLIGAHSSIYTYVFLILDAAALALLGPGAYSVDARLFGRKLIVLPRVGKKQD
jgi:hypothetical protein